MKLFITFFLVLFSLSLFSQFPSDCNTFKITQKGENQNVHLVLISHEIKEIFPARNIDKQIILEKMILLHKALSKDSKLNGIDLSKIIASLKYINGDIFICYESFEEQILSFLAQKKKTITLLSETGIPFLKLKRIK